VSLKTLNTRFWLVAIAAIFGAAVTMRLGFWQLGRAHEKLDLQTAIQKQTSLPILDAKAIVSTKDTALNLHRTAKLTGRWQHEHTLFLDNRQMNGKPGFFVLTPFEFEDKTQSIKKTALVQRGWVARDFLDRQKLPQIKEDVSEVTILGRIAPAPSKLYEFKGADGGIIRQNVSIAELSQEFKIDLLDMTLLQIDAVNPVNSTDGLLRHWAQPNLGVEKHYGYMFQWWALSALIAILYVWFQLIRPRMRASQNNND
jgi:surfeit locus 1 family protein